MRDTGIGIPANRIEELFVPFHQLDGASLRRYGGLGLALVRRIVEAHQSRLKIEGEVGRGRAFSFELPIAGES